MTNLKTYSVYEIGRFDNWLQNQGYDHLKSLSPRQAIDIHDAVKDFIPNTPEIYNKMTNYHFDNESMALYADLQLISGHYIIVETPKQGV